MTWPLPGYSRLSTHFGEVIYGNPHYAIDIPAPKGTPIVAAADGTVLLAGWNNSYGYWALINHSDGISTVYAHMTEGSLAVSPGQTVKKGQTIGGVGNTGFSFGNHLHFEVRTTAHRGHPLNTAPPPPAPFYQPKTPPPPTLRGRGRFLWPWGKRPLHAHIQCFL